MKLSVVIPHYPYNEEINQTLKECVNSLDGYNELILVVNEGKGYAKSINQGLKLAKGDFIACINNDTVWDGGNLLDLCDENFVLSPTLRRGFPLIIDGKEQDFWAAFFIMPRWVYEKVGGFDERFEIGYYEDRDYYLRLKELGIQMAIETNCTIKNKGGQTMKIFDQKAIEEKNKKLFNEKWGL